ncbi:hypothetical protein A8C32_08090 [Flavivirga aquatica]|uniref:Uncharacterized protein n=1 Tax=Flavivirga aquatica TaxID=1849968 RepID=A0A1E5SJ29_9FLAO|nr:hypothetical protein [Flavivirga aquatica]OEJ99125.1 hypothetical protein A8C32_08090 [Flavivirga aquatica]
MSFFNVSLNNQLYVTPTTGKDQGFSAFLLPKPPSSPESGYDISQALTDTTLNGSFILSAYTPNLETQNSTDLFVKQALALLGTGRYIIWILDINDFSATKNTIFMTIAGNGSSSIQGVTIPMVSGISLQIQSGIKLTATDNSIDLGSTSGNNSKLIFTGPDAPDSNSTYATSGSIPLSGIYRGSVNFSAFIERNSLSSGFNWGFQMLIPLEDNPNQTARSEYFPLASGQYPSPTDAIGFNIFIDPTDIFNQAFNCSNSCSITDQYNSRRTVFNFTGSNKDQSESVLNAYYFTVWGSNIKLIPVGNNNNNELQARLTFNNGELYSANAHQKHFAPEGDFIIEINGVTSNESIPLQCGLQGTEFFNVQPRVNGNPGDRLRFITNQPAYAPVYPLPVSSPVTAPVNPNASLLDITYQTSWCTLVIGENSIIPSYVAQPKGSALFSNSTVVGSTILEHSTPNFTFTPNNTVLFPMLPYADVKPNLNTEGFNKEEIEDFEKLFISQIRKQNINSILINAQTKAKESYLKSTNKVTDAGTNVTTPSGLIANLLGSNNNPVWNAIYLAQNQTTSQSSFEKMYFEDPSEDLIQAFQTSDLFLVIANNEKLGSTDPTASGAKFLNKMFIGDWTMEANTGTQSKYNDYNNIIIVKGKKGKLYDPDNSDNSLISNWQKWTAKDTFAAPSILNNNNDLLPPDNSQLVILSQWMQSYFEDAKNQTDTAYFGNFNALVQDENWTGILILRMDISGLPDNLTGILSGVRDPAGFRAHHFGINITPVEKGSNGPEINNPSSMFGLIYYNDPDFIQQEPPQPIQPDLSETYDFVLLNLKVLFENTAVKSFQSYAQLTTNNYFGSPVDHMGDGGNKFNTMILKGALQFKGNEALYSLSTDGVNAFYFNNPAVNKIEISNVNFSTAQSDPNGNIVSNFSINGYWDFKELMIPADENDPAVDFDILSFGNTDGTDASNKGLIFNNLLINMVSPPYTPGQTEQLPKTMTFVTSQITFDQARSTPRPNSMYVNFALNLQGLTQGSSDSPPSQNGYLTVITDLKVSPIDGSSWVGLIYKLNMGTPGELAGNIGLTSTLLTAWNPTATDDGSAPAVLVGITLPGTGGGAKLISLQTVLKLSIGQIRLAYDSDKSSFLLMFTEIALKFFGLLKIPPNGSSLFYLFGNPKSNDKASGLGWYAMYNKENSK